MNWNYNWATAEEMEAFWHAIDQGDLKTVRRLITTNPKLLRWERGDGVRPLDMYATAARPNERILDLLLSVESDAYGMTGDPVLRACRAGNAKTLRALLKRGVDPNGRKSFQFEVPLHAAAKSGNEKLVRLLLDAGADVAVESYDRQTPLETAILNGNEKCVALLQTYSTKRRVEFVDPRRPKKTVEINLQDEENTIHKLIKSSVRAAKKRRPAQITAVALHGSGYQGFVEVGCETDEFDFAEPDCAADVALPRLARRNFPKWRRAYADNNRVIVHYGSRKPWNKTTLAMCETLDEPYFRFFRSILKAAVKGGEFDDLPLTPDCLFGVQTFFHHHCDFWNRQGKKAPLRLK